jgi:F0F1-type ATP synthase delta subunit
METETLTIILGTVLPLYPILLVINQRIGKYDEVVEEFRRLQSEHERMKEAYHG